MANIPTKWDQFGTSIFTVMTQKAIAAKATNLAQGFPDFDGPPEIKEAAIAAIKSGMNQYAPSSGLPELRQLLSQRQEMKAGLSYDWNEEVTIFSGATEAIFCTMLGLFEPGDEILALAPYYDSYPVAAYAAGARIIGVPLTAPTWSVDEKAIAEAITPRTRGIIINTPHNPTGRVLSREELEGIAKLAKRHDLIVITDEVYEELVFAPAKHLSLSTLPGMRERTVVISSTSKTFSMTGWKVGYTFAPPAFSKALRAVHQFTVFCSATPLQVGMTAALRLPETYYESFREDYGRKRAILLNTLEKAGFKCSAPAGTYFILADYSNHVAKAPAADDISFASWLTEEIKVAAIPISGFYDDPAYWANKLTFVRFAFCKSDETLQEASQKLSKLQHAL